MRERIKARQQALASQGNVYSCVCLLLMLFSIVSHQKNTNTGVALTDSRQQGTQMNLISHCKQLENCILYIKQLAPHTGQYVALNSGSERKGKQLRSTTVPVSCLDALSRLLFTDREEHKLEPGSLSEFCHWRPHTHEIGRSRAELGKDLCRNSVLDIYTKSPASLC